MNSKTMLVFGAVAVVMSGLGMWAFSHVCQVPVSGAASVTSVTNRPSQAACYCLLNMPVAAIAAAP